MPTSVLMGSFVLWPMSVAGRRPSSWIPTGGSAPERARPPRPGARHYGCTERPDHVRHSAASSGAGFEPSSAPSAPSAPPGPPAPPVAPAGSPLSCARCSASPRPGPPPAARRQRLDVPRGDRVAGRLDGVLDLVLLGAHARRRRLRGGGQLGL